MFAERQFGGSAGASGVSPMIVTAPATFSRRRTVFASPVRIASRDASPSAALPAAMACTPRLLAMTTRAGRSAAMRAKAAVRHASHSV